MTMTPDNDRTQKHRAEPTTPVHPTSSVDYDRRERERDLHRGGQAEGRFFAAPFDCSAQGSPKPTRPEES